MWYPLTKEQIEGESSGSKAMDKRFFGHEGRDYPRLMIAMYADDEGDGFEISCLKRGSASDAWVPVAIPRESTEYLAAMVLNTSKNLGKIYLPLGDFTDDEVLRLHGLTALGKIKEIKEKNHCSMRYATELYSREKNQIKGKKLLYKVRIYDPPPTAWED
jgi:hypothetical protein